MRVVKLFEHDAYAFVVEDAIAIQSILLPLALVCDLSTSVVEHSSSLHPVLHPFSTIFPALVIVESSEAMTKLTHFISFITSLLQNLTHVFGVFIISSLFGRN